jgi:hypothetical protein
MHILGSFLLCRVRVVRVRLRKLLFYPPYGGLQSRSTAYPFGEKVRTVGGVHNLIELLCLFPKVK